MRIIRYTSLLFFFILVCFETADAQWQVTFGPYGFGFVRVQCFAKQGSNLFAGTQGDGVWISTDNSASPWTKVSNGMTGKSVRALLVNGDDLFAGTDSGVVKTTDNGSNWTALNNGLTNSNVSSFALIGANLFVSTSGGGVFLSTNNGTDWTAVNNDLTSNYISSLVVVGTNLFAGNGGFGGGVFLSTNNGTNWTLVNNGLTGDYVFALAASGTNLFAASFKAPSAQVYHSTDNGSNWSLANTGLPNVFEFCFAVSGTNVFAGAYSGGVYHTTDNGANWVEVNQGFGSSRTIRTLEVLGEDLFAGFYDGNVFRRPLSQMITSVEQISDLHPTQFSLDQNFPNPFNPTTKITWQSPVDGWQTLKVYDVLGNDVATIVDEFKPAGIYEVDFNASGLASGVYYYRLKADNLVESKKLIFMK